MNVRLKVLVFPFIRDRNGDIEYAIFKKIDAGPALKGDYWQSIAGGVEKGESASDAGRREAWEEGGVPPDSGFISLAFSSSYRVGDMTVQQSAFGVELHSRHIRLSEEHSEFRWVSRDEALALFKFDDYREALKELDARLTGTVRANDA
jgi:dihydroneopterin triphosphate diphosphatase